jgi:recombination protein RecA
MIDPNKKEEKLKNLNSTMRSIEKKFGKGSIIIGHNYSKVPILCSTGSIKLDIALGCYGVPEGRITEILGPESSGKTSIALIMAANVQKSGGIVAFVDAEHALDPLWATKLGVNMDEVIFSQPSCGEEALELVEYYVENKIIDFGIVDSVAALVPRAEIEGEMGDSHMGLQARLMSQAMRKLTHKIEQSKSNIVFINQLRDKIGIRFGSPETTTGGNALKYYATQRIDTRKPSDSIEKDKEGVTGQTSFNIKIKIIKNKVATPFKITELTFNTDDKNGVYGFDNIAEIVDIAVEKNIIKKSGAWFSYGEERIGQGYKNAVSFVKENLVVLDEIKKLVDKKVEEDNSPVIGSYNNIINQEIKEQEEKLERKVRK